MTDAERQALREAHLKRLRARVEGPWPISKKGNPWFREGSFFAVVFQKRSWDDGEPGPLYGALVTRHGVEIFGGDFDDEWSAKAAAGEALFDAYAEAQEAATERRKTGT